MGLKTMKESDFETLKIKFIIMMASYKQKNVLMK